jgi:hypothetical protein
MLDEGHGVPAKKYKIYSVTRNNSLFIRLKWVGHHFHDFIRRVKCPPFAPDLGPTDYVWSILESITWSN